jgi:hypothetical protein
MLAVAVCANSWAATWLGVKDPDGRTWARVKFVNLSSANSTWVISNCRTAKASTLDSADVDAEADWDGVVDAGSGEYVWVYGVLAGEVSFGNADGGPSAFIGAETPAADGDGEIVFTIAEDGTVSMAIEAVEPFSVPTVNGSLPSAE